MDNLYYTSDDYVSAHVMLMYVYFAVLCPES